MPPSVPASAVTPNPVEIIDAEVVAPSGKPCPSCGCPVEPADRFCPACGTPHDVALPVGPAQSAPVPPAASPANQPETEEASGGFHCDSCGAQVRTQKDRKSYRCPFCDSNYVVESTYDAATRRQTEFVIGFAISPDDAKQKFREWLTRSAWYNPGDLSVQAIAEKTEGVYLPFWSFPMTAESRWEATIGEDWQRTETYTVTNAQGHSEIRTRTVTETEWYPLSGMHHQFYSGYLISASKGLPQEQALRIMPYNLPALKRYESYFLAGWAAEEYSIDLETAMPLARSEYSRRETAKIRAFLPGDRAGELKVRTEFFNASSDLCLLPVYLVSYRYRDRLYRFLVNGQTGKSDGDKPVSGVRIAVAIAIGAALVGLTFALASVLGSR